MLIPFVVGAFFLYSFLMALYYREREYSIFQLFTILAALSFGGLCVIIPLVFHGL